MKNRTWLITGASQGLGLCLVKQLLEAGYQVAATSRSMKKLVEAAGEESEHFCPVEMDLGDEASIAEGKKKILEKFGTVDVIVNNAGYAIRGMVEEVSDEEARKEFHVNVFSVLNVLRGFAGILREQRSGYIINISSIAGYKAVKWSGIYGATKYAVEGITEALRQEMEPFGVHVFSVNPGDLRTGFHNPDTMVIAKKEIADYDDMRAEISAIVKGKNGKQINSPEKVAAEMIKMVQEESAIRNFFAGSDSFATATSKTASVAKELEEWGNVSCSVVCGE